MVGLGGGNAYDLSDDGSVVVGHQFRWTSADGMTGGDSMITANSTSADGSVMVGDRFSALGREAFRWTSTGGMVGLGDLPGGQFYSEGLDVSADGSLIVGESYSAVSWTYEAYLWDETNGMRSFQDLLSYGYGIDMSGWELKRAKAISADGSAIVGLGVNLAFPLPPRLGPVLLLKYLSA
jgi:uncharacterized membrane protein